MKKFFLTTLILFPAFFLVLLGMRTPSLDQARGPKPRPRAVVENSFKSSYVVSCEVQAEADISPVVAVPSTPARSGLPYIPVASLSPAPEPGFRATRAPPSVVLVLS